MDNVNFYLFIKERGELSLELSTLKLIVYQSENKNNEFIYEVRLKEQMNINKSKNKGIRRGFQHDQGRTSARLCIDLKKFLTLWMIIRH